MVSPYQPPYPSKPEETTITGRYGDMIPHFFLNFSQFHNQGFSVDLDSVLGPQPSCAALSSLDIDSTFVFVVLEETMEGIAGRSKSSLFTQSQNIKIAFVARPGSLPSPSRLECRRRVPGRGKCTSAKSGNLWGTVELKT